MDLAWKRNGIIGLQRCLHWLLSTLSSLSLDLPNSATVPAQWAPGIGSMHYQGAREQTRVRRLEQKAFYWLTYFPSLTSFLSKWRCSTETKSRTPKRGKHPKGGIVHTFWDRVLCSPSCPWTRHVADDTWNYRLEAPCLTSNNISHWLFNKVMLWIYEVKQAVQLKQLPCGSLFLLQLIRTSPVLKAGKGPQGKGTCSFNSLTSVSEASALLVSS